MEYHFNVEVAKKYGADCATIIHNFAFWQKKNQENEKNCHDGCYWTYNSVKALEKLFPWLSIDQIRRCLKKLELNGAIKSGYFNKVNYDRTKWYTITDKSICEIYQLHLAKTTNGSGENHEPIPYSKPYKKPNSKIYRKSGKHQITVKEVEHLHSKYNISYNEIDDLIEGFLNYSGKNKYVSIAKTILKWHQATDVYKKKYSQAKKMIQSFKDRGLDEQLNKMLKGNDFAKYVYSREFRNDK